MCRTPWCFGDCDECESEKQYQIDREEASAECPYRKECDFVTIDARNDRCKTCGRNQYY